MASHTMEYYQNLERQVFPNIPGMRELMQKGQDPAVLSHCADAAFVLEIACNLSTGDPEQNAIHQKAYLSILHGGSISDVRHRYDLDMARYVQAHMWDD